MKTMFAAAIALSLLTGTSAFADTYNAHPSPSQPNQGHQDNHGNQGPNQGPNQGQSNYKPQPPKPQPQQKVQYEYKGKHYDAVRGPAWNAPKGYDSHRNFTRGQKLPSSYRNKAYVVDYRPYHLNQPPRGYEWVRVNNNVYLVKASNGYISQIVFSLFY